MDSSKEVKHVLVSIIFCMINLTLANYSFSQQILNYNSLYEKLKYSEDLNDFKAVFRMIFFDEGVPDSTKAKFAALAINRTKELDFEYYYAQFVYHQSMQSTLAGDHSTAISLANESLEIFLKLEEFTEAASCYNTIGSMIANTGDIETGKKYLRNAIRFNDLDIGDSTNSRSQANNLIVYGNLLLKSNELDSAYFYMQQALDLAKDNNFLRQKIFCLLNLGRIYKEKRNYSLGTDYLKMALKELNATQMQTFKAVTYNHLADISIELDKVDSAIFYLEKGLEICQNHHAFLPTHLTLLEKKAKILAENGSADLAYQLQLEYIILRDSFFSLEKEKEIYRVETEFKAKQRERDIQMLSQQTTIQALEIRQKNQVILLSAVTFFLVSIAVFFIYKQRITKKEKIQFDLEQQMRASELKALRSQMNPHFVFNALNSIQEYIMSNERKLAGKYLGKFADLMRIYLEHSNLKTLSLGEEMEALELYLDMEKLRFEDSLKYEISLDEKVNVDMSIPSLLIQPYVENAIKHGLLHRKEKRELNILIRYINDDTIECEINDNGIGRSKSQKINQMRNPNYKPFASSATRSRLDLLNHDSDNPIVETISDLDENSNEFPGTRVILRIPIIDHVNSEAKKHSSEIQE